MKAEEWKAYIATTYSTEAEYLWRRYPTYCIYRHQHNRKWFALIADVPRSTLGLEGEERIDILDIKLEPLLIDMLRQNDGFFPAYHMNKTSWITIALDGTVPEDEIKGLLDMSFTLTAAKTRRNSNGNHD